MKRDFPRSSMPAGSLWNAVDVIVNYGAPLRQRGGWVHHSQDVSAVTATSTYIRGGVYATFSTSAGGTSAKNIAIDEDGYVFDASTASSATSIGAGVTIKQNPVFHGGTAASAATAVYTGLIVIPDGTGAAVPKKYDGTTLADLGGTPPKARYACVYKDYTVLGNGTVGSTYYPNRIWFSPEGDPDVAVSGAVTAWDTTDSWIDFSLPVIGLGSTRNAMLVFHDSQVSRVRGATPPPDEDMVVDDPMFKVGLFDAMSLAEHKDTIIWASPEGVFRSDAVILDDLTKRGGMLRYWLDLTKDATSTWTFAGGTHRDTYYLCVMDGTTFKDCFAIDLVSLAWTRLSNVDAVSFWDGLNGTADELYWGRRGAARVSRLSTIFRVGDSTYKADGDSDSVAPVVETPYYTVGKIGLKRLKRVYVGYELTDHGTDDPSCAVSFVTTPEETSYTSASSLPESTEYDRRRVDILKQAYGFGLKFTRANSGDFLLYDLGVDHIPQEQSRLAA